MSFIKSQFATQGFEKLKKLSFKKYGEALKELRSATDKLKDIPKTNFDLGKYHLQNGALNDAILRFKIVIFLNKDFKEAYYFLAKCLVKTGEIDAAIKNLTKAIELDPAYEEAIFEEKKLVNKGSINEIPKTIIKNHYDFIAPLYNKIYSENLKYNVPALLARRVLTNITDKTAHLNILDIGCGTGLCGLELKKKDLVYKIQGVDISEEMLKIARNLKYQGEKVYDEVITADFEDYLKNTANNEHYDLILSAGSLKFYGNFDHILDEVKLKLRNGGAFVFSIESKIGKDTPEYSEFELDIKNDVFLHSKDFVEKSLLNKGFKVKELKEVELYEGCEGYIVLSYI